MQSYLHMLKIKMLNNKKQIEKKRLSVKALWFVNLFIFAFVVFLGIEQSGKAAVISNLEDKIEEKTVYRRDLSEEIFKVDTDEKVSLTGEDLGFVKPTEVHYFKTDDVYAGIIK